MRRAMPLLTPRSSRLATILSSGAESPFAACFRGLRKLFTESQRCAGPAQLAVRVLNGHLPKQVSRIPLWTKVVAQVVKV